MESGINNAPSFGAGLPPTLQHLERQFWGRALKIADLNADGTLELHEFTLLMQARWDPCVSCASC